MSQHATAPTRHARRLIGVALAALMMFGVAACSSDPEPPASPAPSGGVEEGTEVAVSGVEYSYVVPEPPTTAGTYTFVFTNDGGMAHDLVIEGVDGAQTATINPGETAEFTVTLEAGDYTFYCSVGNHRAQGMELAFTVT